MTKKQEISYLDPPHASQYIEVKHDLLDFPARFFTYIPSNQPGWEGWEDIIYYTERLKNPIIPSLDVDKQYIYILSNETIPNLLKIGFTSENPESRARKISKPTGVAGDFKLEFVFPCFNAHNLEKEIHIFLSSKRYKRNKEFFSITLEEAIKVVQTIGKRYTNE